MFALFALFAIFQKQYRTCCSKLTKIEDEAKVRKMKLQQNLSPFIESWKMSQK